MSDFYLPLSINLIPGDIRHRYDERDILAAHNKVIRPMFEKSVEAYVYGLTDKSELLNLNRDILIGDRGKHRFDKTKECITGHEYLWNATTWKRGSIVIILKRDFDFTDIFRNTYRPGLIETPNSGNTASATKKCREVGNKGGIGICFPASNGIEWITIYAEHRDELYELAKDHCSEKDWS